MALPKMTGGSATHGNTPMPADERQHWSDQSKAGIDPATGKPYITPSNSPTPTGPGSYDPDDQSTWTEGEKRANAKYGLGQGGQPASMEWWLDQHYKGLGEGRPGWKDYGQKSTQMGDAMRQWQINAMGQPAQMRDRQVDALDMLKRRAGGDDLISQMVAKQMASRLAAQGQSLARSAPGGYNPMAYRNAQQQAAGATQQLAGDAMTAGAQEIQDAQDAYLSGVGGVRTQDFQNVGMIGGIRGQDQARGQQDLDRYGMDTNRFLAEQELKQKYMGMNMQDLQFNRGLMAQIQMNDPELWQKLQPYIGAGLQAVGTVAASMSDVNAKKNIQGASGGIDEFLSMLSPSTYQYKDPNAQGAAPGQHTGVMAQDLEKSALGRQLVIDGPNGKMVDYQKAVPLLLASLVHLHQKQQGQGGKAIDMDVAPMTPAQGTLRGFQDMYEFDSNPQRTAAPGPEERVQLRRQDPGIMGTDEEYQLEPEKARQVASQQGGVPDYSQADELRRLNIMERMGLASPSQAAQAQALMMNPQLPSGAQQQPQVGLGSLLGR